MGLHKDGYATVWEATKKSDTMTTVRLSTSRKNKLTDQYEQDFSGFVAFVGADNASAAARLNEKDRIKLGNIDVTTKYDKEKGREYVNYTCFGFEPASISAAQSTQPSEGENPVGEGVLSDGDVPF